MTQEERAEWEGYMNGLIFALNRKPAVARGGEGTRVLNDLRGQIEREIAAVRKRLAAEGGEA
jgi:hypothetical protein